MRIVVALGGNALLHRGEVPDAEIQRQRVAGAARALSKIAGANQLVICHGNGPQVGVLAEESQGDRDLTRPYPLDVLVAETQGMIGYWLAQELHNAAPGSSIATILTQAVVDLDDPGFETPSKPIGQLYTERAAWEQTLRHGWRVAADGTGWRRVVASPRPMRIVEIDAITTMLDAGVTVVCGGGGGIPVAQDADGRLHGVEAVIDKDLTAALIARDVEADQFIVLSDVAGVLSGLGTLDERPLDVVAAGDAAHYPAGSMRPKITACGWFTEQTGKVARIGSLDDAGAVIAGRAGTLVTTAAGSASETAVIATHADA
jgi:carbamate kinase